MGSGSFKTNVKSGPMLKFVAHIFLYEFAKKYILIHDCLPELEITVTGIVD